MGDSKEGDGVLRDDAGPNLDRVRMLVVSLKSGQWPQAHNRLQKRDVGFCCLGVACEVAKTSGLDVKVEFFASNAGTEAVYSTSRPGEESRTLLPKGVCEWYGFLEADVELQVPERLRSEVERNVSWRPDGDYVATTLNDQARLTLPQIGECFQYTFLRDEWEIEHGDAAS